LTPPPITTSPGKPLVGLPADAGPWQRPLGAVPRADGGTEFRVWAPKAKESVAIRLAGQGEQVLEPE
jgi:1,4-alpha-glucan branching enzyme